MFPSDTNSAGRFRTDLGQQLSRFGPDGLGMTYQEHQIRELVAMGMAGRVAVEWNQYRQVFEAIVSSNGWDGVTAALQLVSHLEGDALNVALLVPAPSGCYWEFC